MATTTGVVPETPGRARGDDDVPPPAAAPTELVALEAERTEKRELLDRAAETAVGQRTRLPAGCGPSDVPALLQRYYWSEPAAEVIGHDPAELATLALGHLRLAEVRSQGSATVDVERLADGRAVVRIITDDMPFLVDSVTAEVVRQGIELRHVVHPIVVVRRGVTGRIQAFCDSADAGTCGPDALSESWMAVVLDGSLDDEGADDLVSGLRTVLADVRAVDEDAQKMRARVVDLAELLEQRPGAADAEDAGNDPAEAAALLRWLADGNFVLLGARDVDLARSRGKTAEKPVPGTGLGVLRSDSDMSAATVRMPEATRAPEQHLMTVTKADARSTVHRPAWLDLVAVSLPAADGQSARQHRLVGLFPTAAYATSVRDVPVLRRRVAEVIA